MAKPVLRKFLAASALKVPSRIASVKFHRSNSHISSAMACDTMPGPLPMRSAGMGSMSMRAASTGAQTWSSAWATKLLAAERSSQKPHSPPVRP